MSVMKVMDQKRGHRVVEWEASDEKRTALARKEFEDLLKGEGRFAPYTVSTVAGRRTAEPIEKDPETGEFPFDPHADELLLSAPLAGGS